MLQLFEKRDKMLMEKYPSHFIEDVLRHTDIFTTNYNFVGKSDSKFQKDFVNAAHEDFVFFGYPSGNYLKQVSVLFIQNTYRSV